MKITQSLIATAVVTLLPLAAFAGDKDKMSTPMGTATSAHFDTLDTNRDGRLTPLEAATDSKIVFTTADKNGDGFLDSSEYLHRDMMNPAKGDPASPDRDAPKPRE
jgi:EF hand